GTDLVTQAQVDALAGGTAGLQAYALATLATTSAAQQAWLAAAETIDTSTGQSTKYSQAALGRLKGDYETAAQVSTQAVGAYEKGTQALSAAQSALDSQQ